MIYLSHQLLYKCNTSLFLHYVCNQTQINSAAINYSEFVFVIQPCTYQNLGSLFSQDHSSVFSLQTPQNSTNPGNIKLIGILLSPQRTDNRSNRCYFDNTMYGIFELWNIHVLQTREGQIERDLGEREGERDTMVPLFKGRYSKHSQHDHTKNTQSQESNTYKLCLKGQTRSR